MIILFTKENRLVVICFLKYFLSTNKSIRSMSISACYLCLCDVIQCKIVSNYMRIVPFHVTNLCVTLSIHIPSNQSLLIFLYFSFTKQVQYLHIWPSYRGKRMFLNTSNTKRPEKRTGVKGYKLGGINCLFFLVPEL